MKIYKKEGNKIYFGCYYIKNKSNMEPIEWDILDEKNGKALIISHYILDAMKFEDKSNNYEKSYIRNWLNNDFYDITFNDLEKSIIEITNVDNSILSTCNETNNPYVCNNTNDKIFLLSIKEIETYFKTDRKRQAEGSDYAKRNGLYGNINVFSIGHYNWWLRSPYFNNVHAAYYIDSDGGIHHEAVYSNECGIRPACWIKL